MLFIGLVILVISAVAASIVGHPSRERRNTVLGLVLGPIGVIVAAVMRDTDRQNAERSE